MKHQIEADILCFIWILVGYVTGTVVVKQAEVGSTAVLPCPSSDDDHRFMFWQLVDDRVLGPEDPANRTKYKYYVLTGQLDIRAVTKDEAGYYKCISKGVRQKGHSIGTVELVVHNTSEEQHQQNVIKGVVGAVATCAVLGIFCLVYKFRWRSTKEPERVIDAESMEDGRHLDFRGTGFDNPTLEEEYLGPPSKTLDNDRIETRM